MVIDSGLQLQGFTADGKVPQSRVTTAQAAREMYQRSLRAYEKRHKKNALVKGLVDGNPPYNQQQLEKNAQRYRANFNNGEAEAYLNTAITAFYDLFSEVETYAVAKVPEDYVGIDAGLIEDEVTKHFHALLRSHPSFDYNIQLSIHDMVLYGSGPHIWEDPESWQSKAVQHNHVLFPDGSPSNVNDLERFFVTCHYRVDELYRFIRDEEAARARGWDVDAVKEALMRASDAKWRQLYPSGSGWPQYQEWIRNNEMYAGDCSDRVQCARLCYKEFDGKVTELVVEVSAQAVGDRFLYKAESKYDGFTQCLNAFFYDRGDGTAHSVRGLGVKMHGLLQHKQRLQLAAVDAAFMRSALIFQSVGSSAVSQQTLSIVNLGPFTVVPHGLNYLNTQTSGVLDAPMMVGRDLDNTLAANLGQYRARLEKPDGNPRTATEVQSELQKQSILGKTQIARYYQQLDEYYQEVFRRAVAVKTPSNDRALRAAVAFQERCVNAGVPRDVLIRMRVSARRSVGQGSAFLRSMSLMQTFSSLYPVLPEDGKQNLVDDVIASQTGRDTVVRYNPKPEQRLYEPQQRWEAQVENDTLRNRGQVLVTPYQNDVIHLQEHLSFGAQAAQSLQQGADPADIFGTLQAVGQHCGMHLQRLSTDPTRADAFKVLLEQFQQLAKITDEIGKQLQEQAAMAQEQQETLARAKAVEAGTDPDTMLKQAELQAKIQRDNMKAAAQMELKAQKQRADLALKDAQAASGIRRDTVSFAADEVRKSRVAAAEQAAAEKPAGE